MPIQVPSYISPIAVAYNLPGVDELRLSPQALAGIMAGKITDLGRPGDRRGATPTSTCRPSASTRCTAPTSRAPPRTSPTTSTTVAPDVWDAGVVETWPTEYGGEGAKGTSGVVQTVENSEFSIGYADASQTADLGQALIGVGDDFVEPSAEAAAKILEASPEAENASDTAVIYDLDFATEEAGTYPIVLTSYLMACQTYDDAADGELVKAFMEYVVSDAGPGPGRRRGRLGPAVDRPSRRRPSRSSRTSAEAVVFTECPHHDVVTRGSGPSTMVPGPLATPGTPPHQTRRPTRGDDHRAPRRRGRRRRSTSRPVGSATPCSPAWPAAPGC